LVPTILIERERTWTKSYELCYKGIFPTSPTLLNVLSLCLLFPNSHKAKLKALITECESLIIESCRVKSISDGFSLNALSPLYTSPIFLTPNQKYISNNLKKNFKVEGKNVSFYNMFYISHVLQWLLYIYLNAKYSKFKSEC